MPKSIDPENCVLDKAMVTSSGHATSRRASKASGLTAFYLRHPMRRKRRQTDSNKNRNKRSSRMSEEGKLDGHTKGEESLSDASISPLQSAYNVYQRSGNRIGSNNLYRLALSSHASEKELEAFSDYVKKCQSRGCLVTPTTALVSEKMAYIIAAKGKPSDLDLATSIVRGALREIFQGVCSG